MDEAKISRSLHEEGQFDKQREKQIQFVEYKN
jgi:hypothetical protein